MSFRTSVGVGGTFTDMFVINEKTRETESFKAPTTPRDLTEGIFNVIELASEHFSLSVAEFLKETISIIHGTTISTNALIEGKTPKIGLITTKGFRDVLLIREGGKDSAFDWSVDYPDPYVPRYLTLPLTERINAEGDIEVSLNEDEARKAVQQLKKFNVEGIAVALLWSIANPSHEMKVGKIIEEEWPGMYYCLSHEVNPIVREYRRFSSTVINASIYGIVSKYLMKLEGLLKKKGFRGSLLIATSSGGVMSAEEVAKKPIMTVNSGPSMLPVAALGIAVAERNFKNVSGVDMGGTSFDVGLIRNGEIVLTRDYKIADDLIGILMANVRSIGAGGGSIAWIDRANRLRVGPQSAGAEPGPACYMLGGTEPTVTDANLVLGYLDPDYFLGGRLKLDPKLAEWAIKEKIANKLGLELLDVADLIVTTINYKMATGIRDFAGGEGIDLREFLFVGGGGAFPLHAVPIARELKIREVIIPKHGGVFSSYGGSISDIKQEFSRSYLTTSTQFDHQTVNKILEELEQRAREFLKRSRVPPENREITRFMEARYPYQIWELEVRLRSSRVAPEMIPQMVEDFHNVHEMIYGVKDPEQYIEAVHWRMRAIGKTLKPRMIELPYKGEDPSVALKGERGAYFKEMGGLVQTPVYQGDDLGYGNRIDGPAIIEEPNTTIVICPKSRATITKFSNYFIEIEI